MRFRLWGGFRSGLIGGSAVHGSDSLAGRVARCIGPPFCRRTAACWSSRQAAFLSGSTVKRIPRDLSTAIKVFMVGLPLWDKAR